MKGLPLLIIKYYNESIKLWQCLKEKRDSKWYEVKILLWIFSVSDYMDGSP